MLSREAIELPGVSTRWNNKSVVSRRLPSLPGRMLTQDFDNIFDETKSDVMYEKAKEEWRKSLQTTRTRKENVENESNELIKHDNEKDQILASASKVNKNVLYDANLELQKKILDLEKELLNKNQTIFDLKKKERGHDANNKELTYQCHMLESENENLRREKEELEREKEEFKTFLEETIIIFQKNKEATLHKVTELADELEVENTDLQKNNEICKSKINALEKMIQQECEKRKQQKEKCKSMLNKNLNIVKSLKDEVHKLKKENEDLKMKLKNRMEKNISLKNGQRSGSTENGNKTVGNGPLFMDNGKQKNKMNGGSNGKKQAGNAYSKNKKSFEGSGTNPDKNN